MESLSELNHSHPDLLHWFVRVEHSLAERWHLHFLLGHERTTNGHHTPMTVETVCRFLSSQWFHGESHVVPYDRTEDSVGYVTKTPDRTLIGKTQMSPSLFKILKRAPSSSRREDEIKRIGRYHDEQRDPDIAEIIIKLRRIGINASFGDEGLLRKIG